MTKKQYSTDELNDRINHYWLQVYDCADTRDPKRLLQIAFALKELYKKRDIQL